MVEIGKYLTEWGKKLSLSEESIKKEFDILLKQTSEELKDLSDDEKQQRALQRLALMYKKQLRSPAVGFEGIIIGAGDCINIVAKRRREASEMFKTDPQSAIAQGVTDEEGTPLDVRKEWNDGRPNFMFGKPLPEENLLRNVFGIAVKSNVEGDTPRFFSMTLNGDTAKNEDIPLFTPLRFMGIDKTPSESTTSYILNSSTFTKFVVDETLSLPEFQEMLKTHCSDKVIEIDALTEYHGKVKDDFNRIVITTGDVSSLNLQPTSVGSRVMVVEDIEKSLIDLEAKGVTCWIPTRCNIDFAEGSKVLVIGRTAQGKKRDAAGNATEELGDVTINVYGLYAIPEYKISPPEEITELTEDNVGIV